MRLIVVCFFTGLACIWDYTRRKIPNILSAMLLCYLFYFLFQIGDVQIWINQIFLILFVFLFFYSFYRIGYIGAGDVKLITVCSGFFLGERFLFFLFFTFFIGAVISLGTMLVHRDKGRRKSICMAGPVCFSVLLSCGGVY